MKLIYINIIYMTHHTFKKQNVLKYNSEYLPTLQRKALYTNLEFIIDTELKNIDLKIAAKSNSTELKNIDLKIATKSNNTELKNIDLKIATKSNSTELKGKLGASHKLSKYKTKESNSDSVSIIDNIEIDKKKLYKIIANEFLPFSLVSVLNRYIYNNDLITITELKKVADKVCTDITMSNKSCIKINNRISIDIRTLLSELNPATILDIGGTEYSKTEILNIYPESNITTVDFDDINKINNTYELIIISQYIHHLSDEDINKLIDKISKILDGTLFIRDIDITDETINVANFIHDLYSVFINESTTRDKLNYITKDKLIELFSRKFNLIAESQRDSLDSILPSYSISFSN